MIKENVKVSDVYDGETLYCGECGDEITDEIMTKSDTEYWHVKCFKDMLCDHIFTHDEPQTVDGKIVLYAVVCDVCNCHIGNHEPIFDARD